MSHLVLYRKYRPQKFGEIAGQVHVVKTITNQIKHKVVAHGYLFGGPRGIGKTTVARLIAKALNCENRKEDVEPCDVCISCKEISGGRSLDLMEIDAASNRGVDEIRELREKIRFVPSKGKYKIYIIDEAHMLTKEAFNALLKTLEEPPAHAVFILATTEVHKIPPTIISRVQRFDFKNLSIDEIIGKLKEIAEKENINIDDEALRIIALNANGGMRDAASLLGQIMAVEDKEITAQEVELILGRSSGKAIVELVDLIISKDLKQSIFLINNILEDGFDLSRFTRELVDYLRNALLIKTVEDEKNYSVLLKNKLTSEQIEIIEKQAENLDSFFLIRAIELFSKSGDNVDIIPQLGFEIALIELLGDNLGNEDKEDNDNGSDIGGGGDELSDLPAMRPTIKKKFNISSNEILLKDKPRSSDKSPSGFISALVNSWMEIASALKDKNYTAAAFLKQCVPLGQKDKNTYIAAKFDFHKEKLNEPKTKYIIEEVLMDKFKQKVILCFVNEKEAGELGFKTFPEDKEEKTVADALQIFGGEVVE